MFATKSPRNKGSHLASLVVSLVAVVVAGLLLMNRQFVIDQMSVWQYEPPAAISAIVVRTSMTPLGERYFYASHPAIEDSKSFNQDCVRKEQNTAILGCYTGSRIYIYDISDPRLDGIKEVTSAHEMLHVAYDRLSLGEQHRIDNLLEVEYEKLKDNKEFSERMAFYARTEPGERGNELHSVIGTEVADISPELKTYYQQYFKDRASLVALHATYISVFTDLQTRAAQLSSELKSLSDSVSQRSTQYNDEVAALNVAIAQFNERASSGGFATQAQFQSQRADLLSRASSLDSARTAINDDVARHDRLRAELETIASQSDTLNRSIDSSLAPAPSL